MDAIAPRSTYFRELENVLKRISLDGEWGFVIDPVGLGVSRCKYPMRRPDFGADRSQGYDDLLLDAVPVPGCWQLYRREYSWYDGVAFFFKTFARPKTGPGGRVFLRFHGVSYRAEVWLNDKPLGKVDYPYLPWEVEITAALEKKNLLVVRVEGRPGPDDTLPVPGWRNFSGLIRSVELRITGPQRLEETYVDSELRLEQGHGRLRIRLKRNAPAGGAARVTWSLRRNGCMEQRGEAEWQRGTRMTLRTPWVPVDFWAPETPALYQFRIELRDAAGRVADVHECAVGFREFRCQDGHLLLNGKPVWLRGVNRHHLHPKTGMVFTPEAIARDLNLVQELGCNALRLAHELPEEAVLDECDRRGILVWVEIPVTWQVDFTRPVVRQRMLAMMRAAMHRDYNHPSAVIWAVANEVEAHSRWGYRAIKDCAVMVRRLDPMRPTTFATFSRDPEKNRALRAVDFVSVNKYRGWYIPDIPELERDLEAVARASGKLLVLSEFGAGSVAGCRGSADTLWTEEYQARVVAQNLAIARKKCQGAFVWLLSDFNDPSRVHAKATGGFINNKGLTSEDRRHRKVAFGVVRDLYHEWMRQDAAKR